MSLPLSRMVILAEGSRRFNLQATFGPQATLPTMRTCCSLFILLFSVSWTPTACSISRGLPGACRRRCTTAGRRSLSHASASGTATASTANGSSPRARARGTSGLKGSLPTTWASAFLASASIRAVNSADRSCLLISTAAGTPKRSSSSNTRSRSCSPEGVGSVTTSARSHPVRLA